MPRQINTKATPQQKVAAGGAAPGLDSYVDVLLKLIPAEVVAAYLTIQGITGTKVLAAADAVAPTPVPPDGILLIVASILLFVATPLYLWKVQGVTLKGQLIITMFSFAVWLFAIGGPFTYIDAEAMTQGFREKLSAVLLVVFVFLMPLFYRP